MKSRLMLPLRHRGRSVSVEIDKGGLTFRLFNTQHTAFLSWERAAQQALGGYVFHERDLPPVMRRNKHETKKASGGER